MLKLKIMAKLIRDIIPPQEAGSGEREKTKKKNQPQKKKLSVWSVSLGIIILLILSGFLYQLGFTSFRLTVYPQTQIVSLEKEILVAADAESLANPGTILGKFLVDSQKGQDIFQATGQVVRGQKAEGMIKVYNAYQPAEAITLRASTRFLSGSGKYFQSPEKIYLPAAQWEGGKLIPSMVITKVVAMEEGPDYNITPDKFSVPGLAGTVYYDHIYAESSESITGGEVATIAQVTEEDWQIARESLKEQLFSVSQQVLKEKAGPDFVFLPAALLQEVEEEGSSVAIGEEVEQFDYYLSVASQVLTFPEVQVLDLMEKEIQAKIGSERAMVPESLMVTYYPLAANFDQKIIDCNLKVTAKVYSLFGEEDLKKLVAGKTVTEAKTAIQEYFPQLEEVRGSLHPFWARKIPTGLSKIQIEVYLDY